MAAGGIVENNSGQLLFIKRFGKWDLPKGKLEKQEEPLVAAEREIMEECNVSGLIYQFNLPVTYHSYQQKGRNYLKITHWYYYQINSNPDLIPQTEEGITEVAWIDKKQLNSVRENTYCSINFLLDQIKV